MPALCAVFQGAPVAGSQAGETLPLEVQHVCIQMQRSFMTTVFYTAYLYIYLSTYTYATITVCVYLCVVWLPSPGVLQEAQVPVVDRNVCDSFLEPGLVTENMICTGFLQGGTNTCQVHTVSHTK